MIAIEAPKIKFQNCRIVGERVNPEVHHRQEHERGELGFVMSRGELMRFNECPAKWKVGSPQSETSEMRWGSLIDCLLLVPEEFHDRFAVCPETYPDKKTGEQKPWNFNSNFCKEWREDQEGKTILKHDDRLAADAALRNFNFDEFDALRAGARCQVSLSAEYFDSATELTIPIRALLDLVPGEGEYQNSIVDLKTTSSAEPRAWARKVSSDHLDAQAALYLDLWKAATGEERCDFRHVIQESDPPYHVELRLLSAEFIELGRIKYGAALKKYCGCLASGVWPGYQNKSLVFGRWGLCEPEAWMVTV